MIGRIVNPPAFGLLLAFAATAYGGVELVAYQGMADQLGVALATPVDGAGPPAIGLEKSAILSWTNVTGVAGWARGLWVDLVRAETPDDSVAIERALSESAEVSPSWGPGWQDLAEARLAAGASFDSVIAAFRMSDLTGSHEGFAMDQRAIFGLEHWTQLPQTDRRTVVRDMLAAFGPGVPSGDFKQRYHELLAAMPKGEREDVRAALTSSGLVTQEMLQALGL